MSSESIDLPEIRPALESFPPITSKCWRVPSSERAARFRPSCQLHRVLDEARGELNGSRGGLIGIAPVALISHEHRVYLTMVQTRAPNTPRISPFQSRLPPEERSFSRRRALRLASVCILWGALVSCLRAQTPEKKPVEVPGPAAPNPDLSLAPAKVDVKPVARDEEIRARIQRVLDATNWFTKPKVRVEEGVVFLDGQAPSEEVKKWAGTLAGRTEDVVAVVNRMEVLRPSVWDLTPARKGLMTLWRDFIRSLPFVLVGLFVLTLSVGAGILTVRGAQAFLRRRVRTRLLRNVLALSAGALVLLLGVYIILRVSGLTQLALTVVGGTGLVGLALGIAFRAITENFLASIFLSIQKPFETADLVELCGVTGYVQQLNMRTTVVMALDGNVIQIPNASVYKSNIRNFTTNANRREDFVVGIGYDDTIDEAQEIARKVLQEHPAVLSDPEPLVLADSLGSSTVNLRIYFWLNGREHSWLKVRSSIIRLVKRAFQNQGISMPDQAREVIFPQGVPVTSAETSRTGAKAKERAIPASPPEPTKAVSTKAEAGLSSEAGALEEQARKAQPLKEKENLLSAPSPGEPS